MSNAATFAARFDQASIDQAAALAALRTTDDVTAWAAARGELEAGSPMAAYFGHAGAVIGDLLAIIARDRAELAHSRSQVTELADQLAAAKASLHGRRRTGTGA